MCLGRRRLKYEAHTTLVVRNNNLDFSHCCDCTFGKKVAKTKTKDHALFCSRLPKFNEDVCQPDEGPASRQQPTSPSSHSHAIIIMRRQPPRYQPLILLIVELWFMRHWRLSKFNYKASLWSAQNRQKIDKQWKLNCAPHAKELKGKAERNEGCDLRWSRSRGFPKWK